MTEKETCNSCGEAHDLVNDEELRRQIKGNLMIAADSWDLGNLLTLEKAANDLALTGVYAQAILHEGLLAATDVMYDAQGKLKLTSNPDEENNVYRVLAGLLAKHDSCESVKAKPESQDKNKDKSYDTFF